LTHALLNQDWLLYLPILIVGLGWLIAFWKKQDSIAIHFTFWGMFVFLVAGAVHVFALLLPLVVTIGKLE